MLLARPTANVNCHTAAGLTPLHYASVYGRADIAMLLLKAGADPLAVDLYSRTPLVRPGLLLIQSRLLSFTPFRPMRPMWSANGKTGLHSPTTRIWPCTMVTRDWRRCLSRAWMGEPMTPA
jgi:hypothetical protein